MLIFLLVAIAVALLALLYDAYWTDKGIKAGLALEANEIVTTIARTKTPTLWQVFSVEAGVIRVPMLFVGLLGGSYLACLMATSLVVLGIKNIQGARQWQWMFKHPGQKIPVMNTVWQKIVGFWG